MTGSNKFWSIIYSIVLILQTFYWLQPHDAKDDIFAMVIMLHFAVSMSFLICYLLEEKVEKFEKFIYGSPTPILYKQIRLANVAIFFIGIVFLVNYPPTAEPMGWASGVNTPSNLGSSS